jgi:hypothetical protein
MALNVVLLETALRLELRGKPTLRGHRKSVVRDPEPTSATNFHCDAQTAHSLNGVVGCDPPA